MTAARHRALALIDKVEAHTQKRRLRDRLTSPWLTADEARLIVGTLRIVDAWGQAATDSDLQLLVGTHEFTNLLPDGWELRVREGKIIANEKYEGLPTGIPLVTFKPLDDDRWAWESVRMSVDGTYYCGTAATCAEAWSAAVDALDRLPRLVGTAILAREIKPGDFISVDVDDPEQVIVGGLDVTEVSGDPGLAPPGQMYVAGKWRGNEYSFLLFPDAEVTRHSARQDLNNG